MFSAAGSVTSPYSTPPDDAKTIRFAPTRTAYRRRAISPSDVDFRIEHRFADRAADRHLRRLVADRVRPNFVEDLRPAGASRMSTSNSGTPAATFAARSARQIIDDERLVAALRDRHPRCGCR